VQLAAQEAANHGNFNGARVILQAAACSFSERGLDQQALHTQGLVGRMADQRTFEKNLGYMTSTRRGMTRGMGVASYDAAAADDLGTLGIATSNCFQASMAESFSGDSSGGSISGLSSGGDAPFEIDPDMLVVNSPVAVSTPAVMPVPPKEQAPKARVSKKRSSVRW